MKKRLLLKTLTLTALLLIAGNWAWGQVEEIIYSTGFESAEGFTAGTVYNNTTVAYTGPADKQWGTYYGTPSTTGAISGSQSLQMRYYTSAPNNYGYTFTNFDLPKVTKVTFLASKTNETNVVVSYSIDGGVSYTGDSTFTLATSPTTYEYIISETGEFSSIRLKFQSIGATTNGSRLYIDNVTAYSMDSDPPAATFAPTNGATDIAVADNITITFDEAIRNLDDSEIDNSNVVDLITLNETDENGTPVNFTATIDANKRIITIDPTSDLSYNTVYYVAIASVEDDHNYATSEENITFTTIDPNKPVISDVTITEAAPYYGGDAITVTWTSANVDLVKIEILMPATSTWTELSASSDATDGTESVILPASLMYRTDYKVRVSYVTNAAVNAESSTFTVIATPTIYDFQSNMSDGDRSIYNGSIVRFSGIITARKASSSGYFVQDGAGAYKGIYVYTAPGTLAVGDSVTVQGTITEFLSTTLYLTEIANSPTPTVTVNSTGNVIPDPAIITTGQLTEAYESVFIKIVDAVVETAPDQYGVFTINDGSGAVSVDDDFYAYTPTVGESITISGLGFYSYGAFKILPRSAEDIQSAATDILTFNFTDPAATGTVNATEHTVALTVPSGTPVTGLIPTITLSPGATVSPESGTAHDFTSPATYTVTAADGVTQQAWTVTVTPSGTGFEDVLGANFKIYPNPFMDEIKLEGISKDCRVKIFSQTGQLLIDQVITSNDNRIDTKSLKSGLYMITLINEKGERATIKMLKK